MALTYTTALRNAMANAITTLADAGAGPAYIEIWTAAFATKLATLTMSDPSFGASATGVITAGTISDDVSADASGTAAVFKLFDSTAAEVLRGTVGASSADIIFAAGVAWVAGQIIRVTSCIITVPAN